MLSDPSIPSKPGDRPSAIYPALATFACILFLYLVTVGSQLYLNASIYPVDKRAWGNDFRFFYNGARLYMEGLSPYLDPYYTSPPPMAMCMGVLALLPFATAYTVFFGVTAALCLLSLYVLCRTLPDRAAGLEKSVIFVFAAASLLLGFPFQFLLDRGNTEGLILGLTVLGLVTAEKRPTLAGISIGIAAAFKIYPLLLLLPFFVWKRWRLVIAAAAVFILLLVATLPHWFDWVKQFTVREQGFRMDENGSLANTLAYITSAIVPPEAALPIKGIQRAATVLFLLLSLGLAAGDFFHPKRRHRDQIAHVILYFPLMVSFPHLVCSYELVFAVCLIPALSYLFPRSLPADRPVYLVVILGIALSQLQAVSLHKMFGTFFVHAFPSLGLLIATCGCIYLKWRPQLAESDTLPQETTVA